MSQSIRSHKRNLGLFSPNLLDWLSFFLHILNLLRQHYLSITKDTLICFRLTCINYSRRITLSIDELNISMEPMAYSPDVNINSFASEIMEREKKKLKKERILFPNQ